MRKKFPILLIVLVFLFFSGCTQSPPHYTNSLEENISKILVPGASTEDVWDALANANIPEKIGYRPSLNKIWIMAEIDPINNTWIAIDVDQKEIIHEHENKLYFSGIFFNSFEEYQKELNKKNYTEPSFLPIHSTTTVAIVSSPPVPYKQSFSTEIDLNSIFIEALIGFILSLVAISLFGFDVPGVFGGLVLLTVIMGAVFSLTIHPSTDISAMSFELTNFIGTWAVECAKISIGDAFGILFGSIVHAVLDVSKIER
ncbi:MAG: hypothetical protein LUQ66_10605 [Methanoregula sp.]|nr:hypothetical protein [Methanoregula sp.]